MKKISLIFSSLLVCNLAFSQMLDNHRWQNRVILLFSDQAGKDTLQKQTALLTQHQEGVTDRDLVIYQIYAHSGVKPNGKAMNSEEVSSLRQQYASEAEATFLFILIGKDGTVKMRRNELVPIRDLFGIIDQMPMRRREMRENDGNGES